MQEPTQAERDAYWRGYTKGRVEAVERPGAFVVVFEDGPEDKSATANLMRAIRGVVEVLPVAETYSGHLEWREIVDALGVDSSDDDAHGFAVGQARAARNELVQSSAILTAFFKVATPEQQAEILREIEANKKKYTEQA